MKELHTVRVFKHLISTYRITVYHGSDIILIEKEVRLSWLCRFIKGREYEGRRVYLGHVFLLQDCLHFYYDIINE